MGRMRWMFCVVLVLGFSTVQAQMFLKDRTFKFMNETANMLEEVQEKLFYNEEHRGYFAWGLKHQKLAVIYYDLEKYRDAACHSKRARTTLFNTWSEYNRPVPQQWLLTKEEETFTRQCPMFNVVDSNLVKYTPQLELEDEPYIGQPLKRIRVKR